MNVLIVGALFVTVVSSFVIVAVAGADFIEGSDGWMPLFVSFVSAFVTVTFLLMMGKALGI